MGIKISRGEVWVTGMVFGAEIDQLRAERDALAARLMVLEEKLARIRRHAGEWSTGDADCLRPALCDIADWAEAALTPPPSRPPPDDEPAKP